VHKIESDSDPATVRSEALGGSPSPGPYVGGWWGSLAIRLLFSQAGEPLTRLRARASTSPAETHSHRKLHTNCQRRSAKRDRNPWTDMTGFDTHSDGYESVTIIATHKAFDP
jgi:hypothetical protein